MVTLQRLRVNDGVDHSAHKFEIILRSGELFQIFEHPAFEHANSAPPRFPHSSHYPFIL